MSLITRSGWPTEAMDELRASTQVPSLNSFLDSNTMGKNRVAVQEKCQWLDLADARVPSSCWARTARPWGLEATTSLQAYWAVRTCSAVQYTVECSVPYQLVMASPGGIQLHQGVHLPSENPLCGGTRGQVFIIQQS